MAVQTIDVQNLTDIVEIQQAYSQLHIHEQQLNNELDTLLEDQTRLDSKMHTLQKLVPNLHVVEKDAQQLFKMISHTSDLAEKVSSKVRQLDLAKGRIQETIKRADDILDLKYCVDGVQSAMNSENYEQAAAHIHRYLTLDENVLKEAMGEGQQDTDLYGAFNLLHEAEGKLKLIVNNKFDEAVTAGDAQSVERFFKIFPLLGLQQIGLEKYAKYLSMQVASTSKLNLHTAINMDPNDRKANVVYAETMTLLFEGIARIVEDKQPLVETYYGPGRMFILMQTLQKECDNQSDDIMEAFRDRRNFNSKLKGVQQSQIFKSSSANLESRLEPRDLDILLSEVALLNTRTELYLRFLTKRVTTDVEVLPDKEKEDKDIAHVLDKLISNSGVCRKMQELMGCYIMMEEFFMRETVMKAVSMDYFDTEIDDAVTSTMVDDVFFIIQKCIRRAMSSSSIDGICAMLNHTSTLLVSEYRDVLQVKLKTGFPSGSIDLSGMLQGKLQGGLSSNAENAIARKSFLVTLNNLEVSNDNIQKLKRDLEGEFQRLFTQLGDQGASKVESCLTDLVSTSNVFKDMLQTGLYQLCSTAVFPRLKPIIDGFLSISHNISDDEFAIYEVNDPFVQNFISNLESVLSSFKGPLTSANYDNLVSLVTTEVTMQLEKVTMKSEFNRLGGLQFDKELRSLVGYLTAVTQWTIRDKFARLTQVSTILNLEKVTEIMEYWGSNSGPLTWRLTPTEVRQVMALRVDFRGEDINRLKL